MADNASPVLYFGQRVNLLIDDAVHTLGEGPGQPERLKHRANDVWSRGITEKHRLLYRITGADVVILQARLHYRD